MTRPASGAATLPIAAPRKKKVKSSPNPTAQTGITCSPNHGQSSQEKTPYRTASAQDAPLIKFDSSESEPTDSENFDPLVSKSSPRRSGTPNGIEEPGVESKADQPSGLPQSKSDIAYQIMAKEGSATDLFDPLSDLANTSFTGTAQMSKTALSGSTGQFVRRDPLSSRRDSSDLLMHEWSLPSLPRSHYTSLPKPAQPLKMSYPNNPFILGRFQAPTLSSSRPGTLQSPGQNQLRVAYLSHKVSDFHKTSHLRQPFRTSSSVLPPPRQLSPASLAPYTRPPSPMTSQTLGTLRSASSTSSLNSPSSHAQYSTSGGNLMSSMSSSSETLQKKSDFFNDLLDIDFGSNQGKPVSPKPQHELINRVPSPQPSQSNWETFE